VDFIYVDFIYMFILYLPFYYLLFAISPFLFMHVANNCIIFTTCISLYPQQQPSAADSNSRSSRVLEGDMINTQATSVGATIAVALIYLK
jgi:hypothetical protein